MPVEPGHIRALTFDVGGTVFDWHSTVRDAVQTLANAGGAAVDAPRFANDWRRRMFEVLAEVRARRLPWMNADAMLRHALDDLLVSHPRLVLSELERDRLTRVWHRLRVWPDAPAAIEQLRGRFTVVVLSLLSWSLVVDSSKAAGVQWDGILSCEFLGHYKPDVEAYAAGVRLLAVAPEETMMVAAHPWDLKAAMGAGLRSAFVSRPDEWGIGNVPAAIAQPNLDVHAAPPSFDITATDFTDLVRQLMRS